MAEKQTESESKFPTRAVTAAAAIVGIGAAGVYGGAQLGQNEHNAAIAQEVTTTHTLETEAYHDSIEQAVNATYDKKALVGEVEIAQDKLLEDGALELVEHALGSDVYNDIKGRIYDPIHISASGFPQHVGEKYDVVEVDINPQDNDGNEYVVVDPTHVVDTEATDIPTPETH